MQLPAQIQPFHSYLRAVGRGVRYSIAGPEVRFARGPPAVSTARSAERRTPSCRCPGSCCAASSPVPPWLSPPARSWRASPGSAPSGPMTVGRGPAAVATPVRRRAAGRLACSTRRSRRRRARAVRLLVRRMDLVLLVAVQPALDRWHGVKGSRPVDLAVGLDAPLVLVLDARGRGPTAAAAAYGVRDLAGRVEVAGVIVVGGDERGAAAELGAGPAPGCRPARPRLDPAATERAVRARLLCGDGHVRQRLRAGEGRRAAALRRGGDLSAMATISWRRPPAAAICPADPAAADADRRPPPVCASP